MLSVILRSYVTLMGPYLIAGLLSSTVYGEDGSNSKEDKGRTLPPSLEIKCLLVQDREPWNGLGLKNDNAQEKLNKLDGTSAGAKPPNKPDGMPAEVNSKSYDANSLFGCPDEKEKGKETIKAGKLIGTGDVGVVVTQDSYKQAMIYYYEHSTPILLYVNGVPMGSDAELFSIEEKDKYVRLLYRINPGNNAQRLWAMLYRMGSLTDPQTLRVALGWSDAGPNSKLLMSDDRWQIQITSGPSKIFAGIVLAIIIILFLFILIKTDAFRDGPPASWWREALTLRSKLADADPATRDVVLAKYEYKAGNSNIYRTAANSALSRKPVSKEDEAITIVGLSLLERKWTPVPAAFSLARVQLGVWFLFAVSTGVFLWIVYGQLPPIDGSLLVLLGLSIATTGMSLAVDSNADGRSYTPTQGFLADITTGFDDRKQIHRYQAVVVNVLLLAVGIMHVLNQLTYPIFDNTWLAFLGISGVALATGKQLVEAPKATDEESKAPKSQTGQDASAAKPEAGAVG